MMLRSDCPCAHFHGWVGAPRHQILGPGLPVVTLNEKTMWARSRTVTVGVWHGERRART